MARSKTKVAICSRILIGYLIVFTLVIGITAYAIFKLSQIDEVVQSILTIDNRMIESATKVSDIIFSQVRYERKFIISKDESFYKEFLQLKSDFNRNLGEMMLFADLPQTRIFLNNIKESYQNYQSMVHEEFEYLKSSHDHSFRNFSGEKEKAVNSIIRS